LQAGIGTKGTRSQHSCIEFEAKSEGNENVGEAKERAGVK
jgi:hypothetical protein